jgi:hypothetical protein
LFTLQIKNDAERELPVCLRQVVTRTGEIIRFKPPWQMKDISVFINGFNNYGDMLISACFSGSKSGRKYLFEFYKK